MRGWNDAKNEYCFNKKEKEKWYELTKECPWCDYAGNGMCFVNQKECTKKNCAVYLLFSKFLNNENYNENPTNKTNNTRSV